MCHEFSLVMSNEYEMSMLGEMNFFLRLQIKQLESDTFIYQTNYTNDLIDKFDMKQFKFSRTPMSYSSKLELDDSRKLVDQKHCRSSLLYLTTSKPDIMFIIYLCAHFQTTL